MKLKRSYRHGERRTIKWFAWFPIDTCMGDKRWLEWVMVDEIYNASWPSDHYWKLVEVTPLKEYLENKENE